MYTVARSALVMHSAEEMYSLVNDIDAYPRFLPWCGGAEVLARGDREMTARVRIEFRGVSQSFTTRNHLEPFERITMTLVDGPFSVLSGGWAFKPLRPGACRISLDLRFDFSGGVAGQVAGRVVGPVFKHIADSMVESFARRAAQIYGPPPPDAICVEVVYALPERQVVEQVQFASPTTPVTIEQAIRASSIPKQFPEIDLAEMSVGVFGTERPLDWQIADQDRVEIYRPLVIGPTEARRRRAEASDDAETSDDAEMPDKPL